MVKGERRRARPREPATSRGIWIPRPESGALTHNWCHASCKNVVNPCTPTEGSTLTQLVANDNRDARTISGLGPELPIFDSDRNLDDTLAECR